MSYNDHLCSFKNGKLTTTRNFGNTTEEKLLSRMPFDTRPEFDKMFRICVKEEIESLHGNQGSTSMHGFANFESRSLKLRISNIIPQMLTGNLITGIGGMPVMVTLVDSRTNEEVKSGPEASGKVEIVVIGAEVDSVTRNHLERILVHHMEGNKSRSVSKLCLNLMEGTVVLPTVSFLHNKKWRKKSIIRLQARFVDHFSGITVKEAQTGPFIIKDRRNEVYKKHPIPTLLDDVWRLDKVGRRGSLVKSLLAAKIKTVGDFIVRLFLDPQCLHKIFDAAKQAKNLEITTKHAQKCPAKLKYSSDKKIEVVFNVSGEVLGLYLDSQFFQRDMLPGTQKEFAKKLVITAFKNWENVITINDDDLSSTYLPNKSEFLNGIDLIIDESLLFDNMLSAGQRPNPEFLCESLRTRYNEIFYELESVCTSNQHQPGPGLALVCTKVSQENRYCKRWRMLFCVVTFTIGSLTKKCSRDSHVHKKRKLS